MSAPVPSTGLMIATAGDTEVQETPGTVVCELLPARSASLTLRSNGCRSTQDSVMQGAPLTSPVTGTHTGVAVPNATQKLFLAAPRLSGKLRVSSACVRPQTWNCWPAAVGSESSLGPKCFPGAGAVTLKSGTAVSTVNFATPDFDILPDSAWQAATTEKSPSGASGTPAKAALPAFAKVVMSS